LRFLHTLFEVKVSVGKRRKSIAFFAGGAWSFVNDKTFYTEGKEIHNVDNFLKSKYRKRRFCQLIYCDVESKKEKTVYKLT
jgi:hypothetical protein